MELYKTVGNIFGFSLWKIHLTPNKTMSSLTTFVVTCYEFVPVLYRFLGLYVTRPGNAQDNEILQNIFQNVMGQVPVGHSPSPRDYSLLPSHISVGSQKALEGTLNNHGQKSLGHSPQLLS